MLGDDQPAASNVLDDDSLSVTVWNAALKNPVRKPCSVSLMKEIRGVVVGDLHVPHIRHRLACKRVAERPEPRIGLDLDLSEADRRVGAS